MDKMAEPAPTCPLLMFTGPGKLQDAEVRGTRRWLLDDGKRVDGAASDRPLAAEVGITAPRARLRRMFTRDPNAGAYHLHAGR